MSDSSLLSTPSYKLNNEQKARKRVLLGPIRHQLDRVQKELHKINNSLR